jgi:streptogramin lyase
MNILRPFVRRALASSAHPALILLALAAAGGPMAHRAQASRLLVSSGNSVLTYNELTGDFINAILAAGSGGLARSQGLAFGPDGNLYVSSQDSETVLRFDGSTGAPLGVFVSAGSGGLALPMGLVFGPDDNLYVSSFGTSSILRYDGRSGAFIDAFVPTGTAGIDGPAGLAFGPDGNLYVGNGADNSILRFDGGTGAFIDHFVQTRGSGLYGPVDPVFGPDGSLYVTSYYTNSILHYDGQTGAALGSFVPAGSGGLSGPTSLAFGPDGNLYVASSDTDSILRYDGATGAFMDVFVPTGRGGLNSPTWITFAPPRAPTGLFPTALSASQIRLVWTDNSSDEAAFAIWRQSGTGDFTRVGLVSPNVTVYVDTGLRPDTPYTYRVRATNGVYASPWSNTAMATTLPPAPAGPTGLTVKAVSSHQLNLAWTDNSSNETAISIWRRTGSGIYARVAVLPPSISHYVDAGLSPKTTYTYRVRAINNSGASLWSNEASGTTLP